MTRGLCLLALIVSPLLVGACALVQDVPAYMADEVLQVAKAASPDCRVRISSEPGGS